MKKLSHLTLLLLLLAACKSQRKDALSLVMQRSGLVSFAADSKKKMLSACKVTVFDSKTGETMQGIQVAYKVIDGPIIFDDNNSREMVVQTDSSGIASVDLSFTEQGSGTLVAEMVENPKERVLFGGYTEGRTHSIFIKTIPCISVEPGVMIANITAMDHQGNPVENADLTIDASSKTFPALFGTIRNLGMGHYEGKIQTSQASRWTVSVQDQTTHAITYEWVHILPGKATTFRLIEPIDPRGTAPYDQVTLRAQLLDKYDNILNPSSITCLVNGKSLLPSIVTDFESRFVIASVGYSNVNVELKDGGSAVKKSLTVPFVAAWMEDPGYIQVGQKYKTKVYLQPELVRQVDKATVKVRFDGELVSYGKFTPAEIAGFPMTTQTRLDDNILVVEVNTEKKITAKEFPQGLYIGEIDWSCQGEGSTCFGVSVAMSPQTDWWEMCPRQKKQVPKCICVNIIHREGNNGDRVAGNSFNFTGPYNLDDNLEECCPVITAQISLTAVPAVDWDAAIAAAAGADGIIDNASESARFSSGGNDPLRVTLGQRNNCVNFYMSPINPNMDTHAETDVGLTNGSNSATGVINPASVALDRLIGAHEIGHALGLGDLTADGDTDNLMFPNSNGQNAKLTEDQCRTIMSNIDSVRCQ
jgi:hypothetical protein